MPKVIPGYTIQDPTLSNIRTLAFSRQSDGQGGQVFVVTASYELKDEAGVVRVEGSIDFQLNSGAPLQPLATLANDVGLVTKIKTKEGL